MKKSNTSKMLVVEYDTVCLHCGNPTELILRKDADPDEFHGYRVMRPCDYYVTECCGSVEYDGEEPGYQ